MADPYEGLNPDEWRKALAEVRAQIPGMRKEAAALNEELKGGRKTIADIEAEGRRNARIGAAAAPAAGEVAAARGAGLTSPAIEAAERRRAAFLDTEQKQTRLLTRASNDLLKTQERLANLRAALPTLPAGSVARNEATLQLMRDADLEQKLRERIYGRQQGLAATQARIAGENAILGTLRAQLAAADAMVVAHTAMLSARRAYLALGPGGPGISPVPFDRGLQARYPFSYSAGLPRGPYPALPPGPPPPLQLGPGGPPQPPGGPPRPPIGLLPPPGGTGGGYGQEYNRIAENVNKASTGTRDFTSNLQRNYAVLGATSREMRKFGALTTEFISAAGRGAVTVRELGYQVSSTIGKFGGWLAAGSAVYAAFGALQAVGRGAIDTQSGIAQLQRVVSDVNADDAAEQFRDLADAFNLPIAEVSNAAFEMGKVFEDQNDALKATEAVLSAVKVGELDVLTASRYLTSIIQAFNLPASEMVNVFDQINQAQNQFGIRIEDTLAGLSKASGTFKAAGGDLSTLLALITTARRATGQTGEVIGTALARAPNFLRQASNQEFLRGMGIDPEAAISDVIERAFTKAQGLSGQKLQELAAAIFGPQYGARIGTPLLQQFDLYQKVLQDTSPEAAKGSAQRELASVLDQTSEELRKVIVQLEVLGSALAEAGALDVFGLLLGTLNLTLETVNALLDVFNELPEPIRKAVVYMGQFAALVALARRFNVGQSFAEGSVGSRLFTRRNQEGFLLREALLAQRGDLSREAETASQGAVRKSLAVDTQRVVLGQQIAAQEKLIASSKVVTAEHEAAVVAQQSKVAAARSALVAAEEAELQAMAQSQAILKESLVVEARLAALKEARTAAEARNLAAASGILFPTAVGTDVRRAAGLSGLDPRNIPGAIAQEPYLTQQLLQQAGLRQAVSANIDSISYGTKPLDNARARLMANIAQYGALGGTLQTGAQAFNKGATSAYRSIRQLNAGSVRSAATSLATRLKSVGSQLFGWVGPLEIVAAVGIATYLAIKDTTDRVNKVADASELIGQTYGNVDEMKSALERFKAARDEAANETILESASGAFADVANFVLPGDPAAGPTDVQQQFAEAYKAEARRQRKIAEAAQKGLERFRPVSTAGPALEAVYPEYVEDALDRALSRFEKGSDTAREFIENTNRLTHWVRDASNLSADKRRSLLSSIRSAQIDAGAINASFSNLAQLETADLEKLISSYSSIVETGLGGSRDLRGFARTAIYTIATRIGSRSAEERAAGFEQLAGFGETIQAAAKANLDRALVFARSQEDIDDAYDEYVQALDPQVAQKFVQREFQSAKQRLEQNVQRQQAIQRELAAERTGVSPALRDIGGALRQGDIGGAVGILAGIDDIIAQRRDLQRQLRNREDEQEKINQELRGLEIAEKQLRDQLKGIQTAARQQERFDDRTEYLNILSEYRQSQAPAGAARLQIAMDFINRQIDRLLRQGFARNSREVLELITSRQEAQNSIVQDQAALIQAQADYAAAGFTGEGEEVQRAQSELDGLYRLLAFYQAHPRVYTPGDIVGLQAQIREAEAQMAEDAEQEAEDARLALFDIGIARAEARGNEVAAANRRLQRALYIYRHADTGQERRESRVDVIRERAARRDAIFQAQLEDIEFQSDIGRLTLQEQIRAYNQLLDTANLTRDQRRDLRRRIYQLKQEADQATGDFDLRVGDIKLPTIYEIRRAIQGGVNAGTNVAMNQQNNYYVNGSNADEIVNKVARKQDDAARRNRNMARSAGLR